MEKSIFREKSVESISSPDSLNDYIRVVRPSVWATLIAVILLLLGVTYWGFVGRLDSVITVAVISDEKGVLMYADEEGALTIPDNANVTIEGHDYKINTADYDTLLLTDDEYKDVAKLLGQPDGSEVRVYKIDSAVKSGIYKGTVVTESVKPASFVTN